MIRRDLGSGRLKPDYREHKYSPSSLARRLLIPDPLRLSRVSSIRSPPGGLKPNQIFQGNAEQESGENANAGRMALSFELHGKHVGNDVNHVKSPPFSGSRCSFVHYHSTTHRLEQICWMRVDIEASAVEVSVKSRLLAKSLF
jgi:hypothetical protein